LQKLGLAFTFAGLLIGGGGISQAAHGKTQAPMLGTVALGELPQEAQATQRMIRAGGPFPHAKDGITFGNRERLLPIQRRGYYHEYTVKTPRARDRGARRIVCGGYVPTSPEACYYTDDHYASFRRIAE
jgi:ribonuclease T1